MWIARNNLKQKEQGNFDDFYIICSQYPNFMFDREGVVCQFMDNSGITYIKIPPHIFESLHPEIRLEPGEGPRFVKFEFSEFPDEARENPNVKNPPEAEQEEKTDGYGENDEPKSEEAESEDQQGEEPGKERKDGDGSVTA